MVQSPRPSIRIDLNDFKFYLQPKGRGQLTLHFNSPSRRFYLSVIALVVNEMKKNGRVKSVPMQEHFNVLALLNESVGEAAGSSEKESLLPRIYRKWRNALPNLEEASLFKVLGRKKEAGDGAPGKIYSFTDTEKDEWANLFEYMGSEENVRLKFATDKIGVSLNETSIIFGDSLNGDAWNQFISSLRKDGGKRTEPEVASVDRMKYPLPDNPSIAVLPFENMSEDPKQELLCDGMTDLIITALTKVPRLFVIARNSTFVYKGKPVKMKQVSEDLGVQYVLEGSFQRSGNRVRITAQLIDALTGIHLWAEWYNRDVKDIFALQDEITLKVLTATHVKLTRGGEVSSLEKLVGKYYQGEQALDCYLKLLETESHLERWNTADTNLARPIIEEAVAMYPKSPMVHVHLGWVSVYDYWLGNTRSPQQTLGKGIELAQKALVMDDSIAEAHSLLCHLYQLKGEYDKAIIEGERTLSLDPNETGGLHGYGNALRFSGRPEEAIPVYEKAIRLNPSTPSFLYLSYGLALRQAGRFEEAVAAIKKAIQVVPDSLLNHIGLAGTYGMMGQEKEARAEAAEVLRINPKFSVDNYSKILKFKDQSETDKIVKALRKAGLK